ncbi:hypothetical protein LTR53_020202, partial [Teratosphaeriaceae sp. CCFEE 6253]
FIVDFQTKKAGLAFTRRDYENHKSGSKSGGGHSQNQSGDGSKNWSRSRSPANMLQGLQASFRPDDQVRRTNKFGGSDGTSDAIEMDDRAELETSSQSSLKANAV